MSAQQDRPFKKGDVIDLRDQTGVVLMDEKVGLVFVRVDYGAETWTADDCTLIVRPSLKRD